MNGSTETTSSNACLLGGKALLAAIFPNTDDRPSVRWLQRLVKAKAIPSLKIGGKRFFAPDAVRQALDDFEIRPHR
jgi:hypothetical protein